MCCGTIKNTKTEDDSLVVHFDTWQSPSSLETSRISPHWANPALFSTFADGCFQKIGVPQNGWFIRGNPIKMDDLRVPLFLETPRCFFYFLDWTWWFLNRWGGYSPTISHGCLQHYSNITFNTRKYIYIIRMIHSPVSPLGLDQIVAWDRWHLT